MLRKFPRLLLRRTILTDKANYESVERLIVEDTADITDFSKNLPTGISYSEGLLRLPEIEARVYKVVETMPMLNIQTFCFEKKFQDLNLDSLQSILFICELEKEFHCVFEETVFDNFTTPREVVRHLSNSHFCF